MTAGLFFHQKLNYQIHNNQPGLSRLLMLAAFPKHSGELYEQPGVLMEL